ncbi:MAG: nucleotidyltransferase domain-containing protein [Nodosilinea sp.]
MARFGLSETVIEQINGVLAQVPQVEAAIIYGSRAKGNYTPGSDIDLTLMGSELTEGQLLQLETWLDDLLLPYSLDISRFQGLQNPALIDHIQRVGQDFYRRQPAAHRPQ